MMRILVFGDSIAQGFWDIEGGWVSLLRKQYDRQMINHTDGDPPTIFNLGVSGDSSDEILVRFENETKVRASEELVFMIAVGVNDSRTKAGKNYSETDRYRQNLTGILTAAKRYSDKIIFIGLTPCVEARSNPVAWNDTGYTNSRIKEFDDALRGFCEQNKVSFVEIFEPFKKAQAEDELLPDGLHPSDKGHKLMAELIKPKLEGIIS